MSRLLVIGGRGLLGAAICRELAATAEIDTPDRIRLNLADAAAVGDYVAGTQPAVIVNCAAFNDVDRAEAEPAMALSVNAFGVRALAAAARACGAVLVHFSTDFVFDGMATRPYTETDLPNPRGTYAASKLLGEWFALEHPNAYVLRVESLFGVPASSDTRRGSLGAIVGRILANEPVPVFVDRTVSPAYTVDIARTVRELLGRPAPPGLYHCVNHGAATWAEIASEAARLLGRTLAMQPLTLESAGLRAPRPKYSALANAALERAGVMMPPWQDALRRYLDAMARSG